MTASSDPDTYGQLTVYVVDPGEARPPRRTALDRQHDGVGPGDQRGDHGPEPAAWRFARSLRRSAARRHRAAGCCGSARSTSATEQDGGVVSSVIEYAFIMVAYDENAAYSTTLGGALAQLFPGLDVNIGERSDSATEPIAEVDESASIPPPDVAGHAPSGSIGRRTRTRARRRAPRRRCWPRPTSCCARPRTSCASTATSAPTSNASTRRPTSSAKRSGCSMPTRRSRRRRPASAADRGDRRHAADLSSGVARSRSAGAAARRGGRGPRGRRSGSAPAPSPAGSACRGARRPSPRRAACPGRRLFSASMSLPSSDSWLASSVDTAVRRPSRASSRSASESTRASRAVSPSLPAGRQVLLDLLRPLVVAAQRLVEATDLCLDAVDIGRGSRSSA